MRSQWSTTLSVCTALFSSGALCVGPALAQTAPDTALRRAVEPDRATQVIATPDTAATRLDAKRRAPATRLGTSSSAGASGFVSQPARKEVAQTPQSPPAGKATRTSEPQNRRAYDAAITGTAARTTKQAESQRERTGAEPVQPVDPFDPVGIRVGSFVLRPAIELGVGYETNPLRTSVNRKSSSFERVAPELSLRSDWSRHMLNADIKGSFLKYNDIGGNDRPELDTRLRGRVDVSDTTYFDADARHLLSTETPGSPDAPTGVKRPPPINTTSLVAGIVQRWNRLEIALRGAVERAVYGNGELRIGGFDHNSDRTHTETGLRLRASYEVAPGIKPFVEGRTDVRRFDHEIDSSGTERASAGQQIRAGSSFELSRLLTGEFAAGWMLRRYDDTRLPDASGLLIDGSLVWTATGLTTVRFSAATAISETITPGTTSVLKRDLGVEVNHAFRRWLIGAVKLGYGHDDYGGANRIDDRWSVGATLTAKLTRDLWLKAEARHDRLTSSVSGADYTANVAMIGLRLQR